MKVMRLSEAKGYRDYTWVRRVQLASSYSWVEADDLENVDM